MYAYALLLNAASMPVCILSWKRAALLTFCGRLELVEVYPDCQLHSPSASFPWPAVVRDPSRERGILLKPTRLNILARDGHQCQYCGAEPRTPRGRPNLDRLTIDHVVPRSRAEYGHVVAYGRGTGTMIPVNSWENLVTACAPCNSWKGANTPEEAAMTLLRKPHAPSLFGQIRIMLTRMKGVPDVWGPYLTF